MIKLYSKCFHINKNSASAPPKNKQPDESHVLTLDNSLVSHRTGVAFNEDEIPLQDKARTKKTGKSLSEDEKEGLLPTSSTSTTTPSSPKRHAKSD